MAPIESDLQELKTEVINMWHLVISQLTNAKLAFQHFDKDLAREVVAKEKRVNGAELKIDRDCENIFALFCPVAIDLRFLLATLKINSNLERIGDIAEGIAKYVISAKQPFTAGLLKQTQMIEMYEESINLLTDTLTAFQSEDTVLARSVFKKDEFLDDINVASNKNIEDYLASQPQDLSQALWILSIIRKLERVGDQSKNIAEEIIFYLEAKVLKHNSKHNRDSDRNL